MEITEAKAFEVRTIAWLSRLDHSIGSEEENKGQDPEYSIPVT